MLASLLRFCWLRRVMDRSLKANIQYSHFSSKRAGGRAFRGGGGITNVGNISREYFAAFTQEKLTRLSRQFSQNKHNISFKTRQNKQRNSCKDKLPFLYQFYDLTDDKRKTTFLYTLSNTYATLIRQKVTTEGKQ
jgi:hypothetical protein